MKLNPLFDRIIIQPISAASPQKTGSILLPESGQDKPLLGQVIAVGDGNMADGKNVKMQLKTGDTVLYNKYSGSELKDNGKTYIIMRQGEVLALVEEEK